MQLNNTLCVYATSRAIREELKQSLKYNQIIQKVMSIGEFEKKVIFVPNRVFIDDDTRKLLLKEASDFSTFKELKINREFFAFLKNSKFLFSFFDELAVEKVEIEDLFEVDMYATYLEHLEILSTLKKRYISLLDKYKYCDKINLVSEYKINSSFIASYEKIEFYLEGYLNNFEFELLFLISKITTLIVDLHTNVFNKKMIDKFSEFGFDLKVDMHYKIDLSKCDIIFQEENFTSKPIYNLFSSNSKILQVAFVKKSIYDFLKSGINAQDIVVIVPDSSFVKLLNLMDNENNFNFAMGKSFTETRLYKNMSALYEYAKEPNIENSYRLKRFGYMDSDLENILKKYSKILTITELIEEFESYAIDRDEDEVEIYKKELHLFSKLFCSLTNYKYINILHLFLNRLKSCTIDDVSGGKITVMEPLESRGVAFEGVIVVDFNDGIVPNKSQKDMFLSMEVRSLAKLPTSYDRENLQKYYYKRLFEKAKFVNISYIEDEQNSPTRFIQELDIKDEKKGLKVENYHDILFTPTTQKDHFIEHDLYLLYDFSNVEISASSLKIYLDCKRRYYYQYIRKIKDAKIPKLENDERIIGIYIHDALKKFYKDKKSLSSSDELYLYLQKELYLRSQNDPVLRFHIDIWLERLKEFAKNEVLHFKNGFHVFECEKEIKVDFHELRLTGKIDRIDKRDGKLYVLDYKSGKILKSTKRSLEFESNFQLQFYDILASNLGEVVDCNYYDLKSGSLVGDEFFDEKMLLLEKHLQDLKNQNQNFTMCEDKNRCLYCPYIKLCNRGS